VVKFKGLDGEFLDNIHRLIIDSCIIHLTILQYMEEKNESFLINALIRGKCQAYIELK
jgi:hypothetical protein